MKPVLLNSSRFFLPGFGVSLALGFIVTAFLFFKNTREEFYEQDDIIKFITNNFLAWLAGARLFFVLQNWPELPNWWSIFSPWQYPGLSFIGGLLGLLTINIWHQRQDKFRLWRFSDGATIPLQIFSLSYFLGQFLSSGQTFCAAMSGSLVVICLLSVWALRSYRSLTWYPSGKIGFALLSSLALMLLTFGILAFSLDHALYLEAVIGIGLGLTALGWLYYRADTNHQKQIDSFIKFFKQ